MKPDQLKGHLDTLLLAVVRDTPAHGYAIITELRERSAGTFDLPEGTVYPALHRLERAGLLRSAWADVSGRRRRVYQVTGAGATALTAGRKAWLEFSTGMQTVLGAPA
ncbi:MAG: PadR family transcriptional regulator [Actinobacteria bacterium]|nr:PadR family transcriptional regulator [Actinomycetota bacterium]MBV8960574.1 PadR family transcriptional regulator [Actinomycetota bacterium]MBV9664080.1 PadR family transcriptional regulator [Actinomycetota bacterium]MBV9932888.1 PadR family transcriptional regulator [Actinomycetota bacterium]